MFGVEGLELICALVERARILNSTTESFGVLGVLLCLRTVSGRVLPGRLPFDFRLI